MNAFEREVKTLSFSNEGLDRGVVEESMYPWDKTIAAWDEQGLKTGFLDKVHFATLPTDNLYAYNAPYEPWENYYNTMMTEPVFEHESNFAFDPVKRICFRIPFISFEEEIREETDSYIIRRDRDGWIRKYPKGDGLVEDLRPVVTDEEDWEALKAHVKEQIKIHLTPENMHKAFDQYAEGCKRGDYVVRLRLQGFFWCPRDLFGIEEHLYAYYDYPEVLKDIARFQLDVYKEQLDGILKILTPSLVFFEEDFSGKNGPMISPATFDEFVVLKFFGGFNKLAIIEGKDAIEAELKRLEPVIRQGGCIICTDHQAAPHTPLENYRYYVQRLHEVMCEWRGEKAR